MAGVAWWPDPAGRVRARSRRHSRTAGLQRLAGPLAARLPVWPAPPGFGTHLRERGVRGRTPQRRERPLDGRPVTGGCVLLLPSGPVQGVFHVAELMAVDGERPGLMEG